MKYLVYLDGDCEYMVVFPRAIDHDKMAEAMQTLRFDGENGRANGWHRNQGEIVAAGFIEGQSCAGRSETLNIGSRGAIDTMVYRAGGVSKVPR